MVDKSKTEAIVEGRPITMGEISVEKVQKMAREAERYGVGIALKAQPDGTVVGTPVLDSSAKEKPEP